MVGLGFVLFALSAFLTTHLDGDFAGPQFLVPNVIRAVGQALVLTPLSALATAGMEAENAGSASALFNMMRNLGGAIGIAMLQTALTRREQFHSDILTSSISLASEALRTRVAELTQYFPTHGISDEARAQHEAIVAIGRIVKRQAFIMGYADTFFLLGIALLLALAATVCLRKPDNLSAGGAH